MLEVVNGNYWFTHRDEFREIHSCNDFPGTIMVTKDFTPGENPRVSWSWFHRGKTKGETLAVLRWHDGVAEEANKIAKDVMEHPEALMMMEVL